MPSRRGRPNKVYENVYATVEGGNLYAFLVQGGRLRDVLPYDHNEDYLEARERVFDYASTAIHD